MATYLGELHLSATDRAHTGLQLVFRRHDTSYPQHLLATNNRHDSPGRKSGRPHKILWTVAIRTPSFRALVSVRRVLESYESSVIQGWWPDSRRGHRCGRVRTAPVTTAASCDYPSDLTDDEWRLVEPLIPPGKTGGGKRTVIMRVVVNGLMYILSTGCHWRAIPKDLPPTSSVYDYFDLWTYDGTFERIHTGPYSRCR